jgi:hypothetical protein
MIVKTVMYCGQSGAQRDRMHPSLAIQPHKRPYITVLRFICQFTIMLLLLDVSAPIY